jgi:hypothetical protein
VREEWSENQCVRGTEVLYKNCGQERCELDSIMLSEVTFHVMSPEPATQIDAAGNGPSDCAKLAKQEKNWRQQTNSRVTVRATPEQH